MCELRVSPRVVKGVDGGERMIYSEGEERKEKEDEEKNGVVYVWRGSLLCAKESNELELLSRV